MFSISQQVETQSEFETASAGGQFMNR